MKVLAINTSPEKDSGAIALLLDPYLEGMKAAGADVALYYSRDLLIFPCCGNLNCTVRTPGQCMAFDDMRWLRPLIGQADVLVLASPLYFNGHTGEAGITEPVKRLQEQLTRTQDLCDEPYGHAIHTTRESVNLRKVVILSGSGFWEIDDFNPVLTHLKAFCYNSFPELASSVTGGHRITVRELPPNAPTAGLVAIARNAGRRLAEGFEKAAAPVACDGRYKAAGWRHEWDAVTLFEFGVMH